MPSPAPDGCLDAFELAHKKHVLFNNGEEYSDPVTSVASSWMGCLAKIAPSTRFRDLMMAGTHNSASSTIHPSRPFSGIGRCQNLTILEQLEAGIRLLDIRVGSHGGSLAHSDVWIRHGSLSGGLFLPILNQIDSFVTDHPSEIVIIILTPEYGVKCTSDQKLFVLKRVCDIFGSRLVGASEMEDLLTKWTFADLRERGKQVIVFFHPRFCEHIRIPAAHGSNHRPRELTTDEIETQFDIIDADVWMRNMWFNTREAQDLLQYVLRDIRTHGNKRRHQLHCSQLILTPGVGGMSDVVQALAGSNPLRPISLSQRLYKDQVLNKYLRSNASEPWNLFMFDFVDCCPWTVRFLTALNFPVRLNIQLAVYGHEKSLMDVTTQVEKYVCRDRVLFLTNVLEDCGLVGNRAEGGSLVVVYRLNDKFYFALTVPVVDQSTLLLISYYATSSSSVVMIPWSDEGIIHDGQILSRHSPVEKLDGVKIRFNSTSSRCVFTLVE